MGNYLSLPSWFIVFSWLKVKLLKIGFTSVEVILGINYFVTAIGNNPNLQAILFDLRGDGNIWANI